MRLSDLFEAPISDYSYSSYTDDPASSFTRAERKILSSERGKQRFVRAFERTPFNFKVMFWNTDYFDASDDAENEDIDTYMQSYQVGVHDEVRGEEGEPGVIKVLIVGNLSPDDRIPMTPWILAHKIGHAFQDEFQMRRSPNNDELYKNVEFINATLIELGLKLNRPDDKNRNWHAHKFFYPSGLERFLTMRSAANSPLGLAGFEIFPEVIAQYLIAGRVKLSHPKIDTSQTEVILNRYIYELIKTAVGKVIIEL